MSAVLINLYLVPVFPILVIIAALAIGFGAGQRMR